METTATFFSLGKECFVVVVATAAASRALHACEDILEVLVLVELGVGEAALMDGGNEPRSEARVVLRDGECPAALELLPETGPRMMCTAPCADTASS